VAATLKEKEIFYKKEDSWGKLKKKSWKRNPISRSSIWPYQSNDSIQIHLRAKKAKMLRSTNGNGRKIDASKAIPNSPNALEETLTCLLLPLIAKKPQSILKCQKMERPHCCGQKTKKYVPDFSIIWFWYLSNSWSNPYIVKNKPYINMKHFSSPILCRCYHFLEWIQFKEISLGKLSLTLAPFFLSKTWSKETTILRKFHCGHFKDFKSIILRQQIFIESNYRGADLPAEI